MTHPSTYRQTIHRHTFPSHQQCLPLAAQAHPRCEADSCTEPGICVEKKSADDVAVTQNIIAIHDGNDGIILTYGSPPPWRASCTNRYKKKTQ